MPDPNPKKGAADETKKGEETTAQSAAPQPQTPKTAVGPGTHDNVVSAESLGEETVTMVFSRPLGIVTPKGRLHFAQGPQKVPVSLKDHWYLKANKVKPAE